MKYKQGGDIEVDDWVTCRETGTIGQVIDMYDKCGIVLVWWEVVDDPGYYSTKTYKPERTRPKNIRPIEPEELI